MKKLLVVFCLATTAITYAQPYQNATPLIQTLSTNVATIPQGQFSIRSAFKFADGTDTIRNQGTCYFFKHEKNPDSLAQFVVFENDKPMYAYDGERFYIALQDPKKVIVKDVRALGGAPKVIRGNVQIDNLIYKNLLYHGRPTFRASYFDSVYISSVREADKLYQRLTIRDTTIEPMLGNVENNKIISALHYDIAMPEHRLARYTGVVWLFDGWQYELKEFSPITPLPSTATLADYFNVEKLASEYVFEQYDPNAFAKREIPEITAGAKLPDFTLNDLNGNAFAAAKQENGLILLDFWYKGCFPCQLAMPKLENLHQKFGSKGLAVLGVDPIDKDPGKLKEWLKTRNITYNTLFDPEKSLAKAVGVTGYPLLILVDAKTKEVLHVHSGFSETLEETLEPIIKEHLGL